MTFYSPEIRDALAAHIKIELDREVAEYEQKCRAWGDKGYSPKYCYHGAFLWVDYSPACGKCEGDDDWRDTHARSLNFAHKALRKLDDIEGMVADSCVSIGNLALSRLISREQRESIQSWIQEGFLDEQKRILWGLTKSDLAKMVFSNKGVSA